jgi:hypothetical protein
MVGLFFLLDPTQPRAANEEASDQNGKRNHDSKERGCRAKSGSDL